MYDNIEFLFDVVSGKNIRKIYGIVLKNSENIIIDIENDRASLTVAVIFLCLIFMRLLYYTIVFSM